MTTRVIAALVASGIFHVPARADEGMWLLNALPRETLKAKYDFTPDDAWVRHVTRSCVRMGWGGSGSFVSRDGLVITNHHIASQHLVNISSPRHDYLATGFVARTRDDEARAPGLELMSLVSIEDVSDAVKSAVRADMPPEDADKARKAAMAKIEKDSLDKTGLRSEVVTLYGGYAFHLYRYKVYTDVRLVFAPEQSVGFFGGDPDNFEYPRYCLDVALLRVYENDNPARVDDFLTCSPQGVREGELVLVAGHPSRTDRLMTGNAMSYQRDIRLSYLIEMNERRERTLLAYAQLGDEQSRQSADLLFGVQNWLKKLRGQARDLMESCIIPNKLTWERDAKKATAKRPDLAPYKDVWNRIAAAQKASYSLYPRVEMFEDGDAFWSDLFRVARTLVRLDAEDALPDPQRLREFNDARRAALEADLFSAKPIYEELEIARLASSLQFMKDHMPTKDPLVRAVLGPKSVAERAAQLVNGSKLRDVAERRRLRSRDALAASTDEMIALAKLIDSDSRRLRLERDAKVDEPLLRAYSDLSRLTFELAGPVRYPDATRTLRLSFGAVRGYEADGKKVPAWTTVGQTFAHEAAHGGVAPWRLPDRWHAAKDKLGADTPLDFVSTADIVGGNSGSPTLNRKGELLGLIFDGNRESLADSYAYTEDRRRAIHVDVRAIAEAMSKIYGAGHLATEMGLPPGR
jgi:hypothetical protein